MTFWSLLITWLYIGLSRSPICHTPTILSDVLELANNLTVHWTVTFPNLSHTNVVLVTNIFTTYSHAHVATSLNANIKLTTIFRLCFLHNLKGAAYIIGEVTCTNHWRTVKMHMRENISVKSLTTLYQYVHSQKYFLLILQQKSWICKNWFTRSAVFMYYLNSKPYSIRLINLVNSENYYNPKQAVQLMPWDPCDTL